MRFTQLTVAVWDHMTRVTTNQFHLCKFSQSTLNQWHGEMYKLMSGWAPCLCQHQMWWKLDQIKYSALEKFSTETLFACLWIFLPTRNRHTSTMHCTHFFSARQTEEKRYGESVNCYLMGFIGMMIDDDCRLIHMERLNQSSAKIRGWGCALLNLYLIQILCLNQI